MFYLAVSCIALGLLCLLYLGFTMAGRREDAAAPAAPGAPPRPAQEPFRPVPQQGGSPRPAAAAAAPNRAPSPVSPAPSAAPVSRPVSEPVPVMERPVPAPPAAPAASHSPADRSPANRPGGEGPRGQAREQRERITEFRRIDTNALADTLRVYSRSEAPPRETEQPLIVGGVLYMNNSRYLPAAAGQSAVSDADFAPRAFANLRRVGRGTLVLEGGGFHIHCGNANYSYTVSDLEQIVFQERGVALIPTRHDHAVPVFITEEPERIKNYIKKHAHIIHGRP